MSITTKVNLVILLTVAVTATGSYWCASALVQQFSFLTQDESTDQALMRGRQSLFQLHKVREQAAEQRLVACVAEGRLRDCPVVDGVGRISLVGDNTLVDASTWEGEHAVTFQAQGKRWRADIDWPALRPDFEKVAAILKTRSHLKELIPKISDSFRTVFALVMLGACMVGLGAALFVSRSLKRRVTSLTNYADRLATGQLVPAPLITRGRDEVGVLASAMESMGNDLNAVKEKLVYAEKINSWQAVARKVAHEIKNPLTPISLVADHIDRFGSTQATPTPEDLKESARILREEIGALDRMVKDFTSFARLPVPQVSEEDLVALINDYVARNEGHEGIIWKIDHLVSRCPVKVDRLMIFQILHNLANNARLACEPDKVEIKVSVSLVNKRAELSFRDNGPGIAESIRHTLFDAYVTTRSTGDKERGMGLGLAISRKIAEDHGGTLGLRMSDPGHGSEFVLGLPLERNRI